MSRTPPHRSSDGGGGFDAVNITGEESVDLNLEPITQGNAEAFTFPGTQGRAAPLGAR